MGTIRVGNGDGACNWVRDNLSARVVTIGPDPNGKIIVLVSVEVYMFLGYVNLFVAKKNKKTKNS